MNEEYPKCCARPMDCTFGGDGDFFFCHNCGSNKPRGKKGKPLEDLKAMIASWPIHASITAPICRINDLKAMIEKIVEILDE